MLVMIASDGPEGNSVRADFRDRAQSLYPPIRIPQLDTFALLPNPGLIRDIDESHDVVINGKVRRFAIGEFSTGV